MILIDALYINNGGGKILLDYLIEEIENKNFNVHYILDERIQNNHPKIVSNKVSYLEASLLKRHAFYTKHQFDFSKVLCFGNIPPTKKINSIVYTYFHQKIFLEIPNTIGFIDKIIFKLKSEVFKCVQKNTNFWIVQTDSMKRKLGETLKKNIKDKILIIPFYPNLYAKQRHSNQDVKFLYVSSGSPHKNHYKLIEGFKFFFDLTKKSELHLTIGDEFGSLVDYIRTTKNEGYPIVNHGFVNRDLLQNLYSETPYLVYPSLAESFGLGLVEAIECGCDVIGADLPYTYEVCEPSIVFNPIDEKSICNAFEISIANTLKPTKQKIFNQIDDLLLLLKEF